MRGGGSAPASQEEAVAPAAAPAAASASSAAAADADDDDEFAAGERLHRRLDLRLVPHDQYCFGTLYFTGSDTLNKRMRAKAQELGYKLNEYSLMKGDDALPAASEEDVFKHLGMEYLAPADRNI
jgi:DNA polymerase/3'-5' exonuclease PolX